MEGQVGSDLDSYPERAMTDSSLRRFDPAALEADWRALSERSDLKALRVFASVHAFGVNTNTGGVEGRTRAQIYADLQAARAVRQQDFAGWAERFRADPLHETKPAEPRQPEPECELPCGLPCTIL